MSKVSKKIEKKEEPKPLGRPMKGKDRRLQIGVYVAGSVVDIMDAYVEGRKATGQWSYSRSDFINEAIDKHMKDLGLIEGDDDEEKQG